jgi:hypothetical protein
MALGGHLLPAVSDDLLIARNADALNKSLLSNDRYARSHGKMTFPAATSRR